MQQYQVPQFIEVEDKIFGPLTLKQFIYVVGGLGLSFTIFRLIPIFFLAIPLIVIVMGFALALAFYKVNNRSFIYVLESAFYYYIGSKLYLWKKKERKPQKMTLGELKESQNTIIVPGLTDSKLKDLAWSLDINEKLDKKEKINIKNTL